MQPSEPILTDGFPIDMRVDAIRQRARENVDRHEGREGRRGNDGGNTEDTSEGGTREIIVDHNNQQHNMTELWNHTSGLGQMQNPNNSCFASASLQCLTAMELDLYLDPTVVRSANCRNLVQVTNCPSYPC